MSRAIRDVPTAPELEAFIKASGIWVAGNHLWDGSDIEPAFEINHEPFLVTERVRMYGNEVFVVYRNTSVYDDDDVYSPVRTFLDSHEHRLIGRIGLDDASGLMGSDCELSLYLISPNKAAVL